MKKYIQKLLTFMLYISNFVLEIINIKLIIMKRSIIVFAVAGLVIFSTLIWVFKMPEVSNWMEYIHIGVIFLVVMFALFVGYKRLTSERRGEPTEDELSKKVLQKTAALSYYISLYIWVIMLFVKDKVSFDTEVLIGSGILGMAITFALSWLYFNIRGIRNE